MTGRTLVLAQQLLGFDTINPHSAKPATCDHPPESHHSTR